VLPGGEVRGAEGAGVKDLQRILGDEEFDDMKARLDTLIDSYEQAYEKVRDVREDLRRLPPADGVENLLLGEAADHLVVEHVPGVLDLDAVEVRVDDHALAREEKAPS
jgi:hypothetical protein